MTSPMAYSFYNWQFVLLYPLHLFCSIPHPSFLWQSLLCSLDYESVFILLCFSDSIFKCDHTVFVFLWLNSLSIISSRYIHVVANDNISFFLNWFLTTVCWDLKELWTFLPVLPPPEFSMFSSPLSILYAPVSSSVNSPLCCLKDEDDLRSSSIREHRCFEDLRQGLTSRFYIQIYINTQNPFPPS